MREHEPSFWQWEQDYEHPDGSTRTARGLVASLAVEPYDTAVVLRHERTHAGPLDGRLRLLRAARAQLEPILLVHDGTPPVDAPTGTPDIEGLGTRLWRCVDRRGRRDGVVRGPGADDRRRPPPVRGRARVRVGAR